MNVRSRRRNQKVVERPRRLSWTKATRKAMGRAIRRIGARPWVYTFWPVRVEFIGGRRQGISYFHRAMNTRLQVEKHRVTELITGVDLVEQNDPPSGQWRKADPLPKTTSKLTGWAIFEKPAVCRRSLSRPFCPSIGRLTRLPVLRWKSAQAPLLENDKWQGRRASGRMAVGATIPRSYEGGEISMYYESDDRPSCANMAPTRARRRLNGCAWRWTAFEVEGNRTQSALPVARGWISDFVEGNMTTPPLSKRQ